ncbi:MAG: hypothetical protein QOD81_1974 [Solirubrobacteraceae bacterium]|jgi:hypothetical protein|nr:hypothetical protein [Solirubrobacteraceae bacterium]
MLFTGVRAKLLRDRRLLGHAEGEMRRVDMEIVRANDALGRFLGGYDAASAAGTGALSSERQRMRHAIVRQGRHGSPSAVSSAGDGSPGRP